MNNTKLYSILLITVLSVVTACSSKRGQKSHGAIVLGDSSTIVTETDEQYLRDNTNDYQPSYKRAAEEAPAPSADTLTITGPDKQAVVVARQQPEPAPAQQPKNGLTVAFKGVSVFIPGITVKSFRNQDPASVNGVSYSLTSGELPGNTLQLDGAKIEKVMQRYQTVVVLDDREVGDMLLTGLGRHNSDWEPLKGAGKSYRITGLDNKNLEFNKVSANAIQKAIQRAARSNRISRKEETQLLKRVRNINSVKQLPLSIRLQSVVWRITGRDATGRSISKELRIDLPVNNS